jgi:hypothetical protein
MPQDVGGDDIGAPELCAHHAAVTRAAAEKDHVTDRDSERLAESIAHQCPACRPAP